MPDSKRLAANAIFTRQSAGTARRMGDSVGAATLSVNGVKGERDYENILSNQPIK